jgi:hypothetical protein
MNRNSHDRGERTLANAQFYLEKESVSFLLLLLLCHLPRASLITSLYNIPTFPLSLQEAKERRRNILMPTVFEYALLTYH